MATARRNERGRRRWLVWGIIGLVLVGLCAGGAFFAQNASRSAAIQAAAANWQTAEVTTGTIESIVSATGEIAPQSEANIQFNASGTVTDIYVEEGEQVTEGQALAKVNTANLELSVALAEADLKQAQANYNQLLDGASAQDIAQAQAQLAQARGQYTQTAGSVTRADIEAARARLQQAQAQLEQINAGPTSEALRNAESVVQQAETNLATQRDSLSAAKTNAKFALDQAVNSLTQAQTAYSTAEHNWNYVQETGNDPIAPSVTGANGQKVNNTLNDAQRQQYRDAFVQAETGLRNAENGVQQAQVAYDNARQNEITGVQSAEQQLAKAQADLADVEAGAKNDERAAARAAVASAQAELDRLVGSSRSGSLAAAEAGVASAEAALEKLTAATDPNDLAVSEAGVARAQAGLEQAQYNLAQATLTAPFAGTITQISIRVGEPATAAATGAMGLSDMTAYHVDVPIDELDINQVEIGQDARLTLDASPETPISGTVSSIAPIATQNTQGTTTYTVRVNIQPGEVRVMPGMTASVDLVTSQKADAVLVPRRAIQTENGASFVWVPTSGDPDPATGRPASERRDIELGLSNAESIEVLSGLQAGEQVLVPGTTSTFNPFEARS